jgi:MraZ protein
MVEIDGQGRLLIPQILRESAEVKGDVLVFGNLTYLEVRNAEAFRKHLEANPLTQEDEKTLSDLGI